MKRACEEKDGGNADFEIRYDNDDNADHVIHIKTCLVHKTINVSTKTSTKVLNFTFLKGFFRLEFDLILALPRI